MNWLKADLVVSSYLVYWWRLVLGKRIWRRPRQKRWSGTLTREEIERVFWLNKDLTTSPWVSPDGTLSGHRVTESNLENLLGD